MYVQSQFLLLRPTSGVHIATLALCPHKLKEDGEGAGSPISSVKGA